MIEVVITHPDRVEKNISLIETPNNEYGVNDLCWVIYKYDVAGLYFRIPALALEKARKEVATINKEELSFIAACCK